MRKESGGYMEIRKTVTVRKFIDNAKRYC